MRSLEGSSLIRPAQKLDSQSEGENRYRLACRGRSSSAEPEAQRQVDGCKRQPNESVIGRRHPLALPVGGLPVVVSHTLGPTLEFQNIEFGKHSTLRRDSTTLTGQSSSVWMRKIVDISSVCHTIALPSGLVNSEFGLLFRIHGSLISKNRGTQFGGGGVRWWGCNITLSAVDLALDRAP
jgi:hypothetical protein